MGISINELKPKIFDEGTPISHLFFSFETFKLNHEKEQGMVRKMTTLLKIHVANFTNIKYTI